MLYVCVFNWRIEGRWDACGVGGNKLPQRDSGKCNKALHIFVMRYIRRKEGTLCLATSGIPNIMAKHLEVIPESKEKPEHKAKQTVYRLAWKSPELR